MTTLISFLHNTTSHSMYRACIYTSSIDKILKKKAIAMIIQSLRAVYDDEELQIEGLKMLQILSKTKEGYRQISETQGGWQSMCQVGISFLHFFHHYLFVSTTSVFLYRTEILPEICICRSYNLFIDVFILEILVNEII